MPTRISYDNTTIAVKKAIGASERELTTEFLRLESHFLFGHRFCRVWRCNEKGPVENVVGYGRRNFSVPVPSFGSFAELNAHAEAGCRADLDRRCQGKPETKRERLIVDKAMLAIPDNAFEARRVEQRRANSLSLVRFGATTTRCPPPMPTLRHGPRRHRGAAGGV